MPDHSAPANYTDNASTYSVRSDNGADYVVSTAAERQRLQTVGEYVLFPGLGHAQVNEFYYLYWQFQKTVQKASFC
jgi:hypothetical protein